MCCAMADIKSMGLYRNVERILADLKAEGYSASEPLSVDTLTSYDQYHYEGTHAVDDAITFLKLDERSSVLDVGSGLGGPARYIANRTKSRVTALELQPDLNATGTELTQRCGLDHLVSHVKGDVLAGDAGQRQFDALVSMLCFLHIPDRESLFANCASALKRGGRIFIDDYFAQGDLTQLESAQLVEAVFCPYLPNRLEYIGHLETAGFLDVQFEDRTADWTKFVAARLESFHAATPDLSSRYGSDTVESLDHFYTTVADLFVGGNLGGARLTARLA
jgi:cyclopropane fatty-acyl-phospholipid synthase-like methyltransferase